MDLLNKRHTSQYAANLAGTILEQHKREALALQALQDFRAHLHSDKFTGVDADGERKDWISTKDSDSQALQVMTALTTPIDWKIVKVDNAWIVVFPNDADSALEHRMAQYSEGQYRFTPGELIGGYYRVIEATWHTVQFESLDNWKFCKQVQWVRADGEPTYVGELVAVESKLG